MKAVKKVVFVTGATSGIGKAIASFLSKNGFKVYGTGRNVPLGSDTSDLTYLYLDVKKNESVVEAINLIREKEKKIDILINCAGVGITGPFEEIPLDGILDVFETNYFGVVRVTKQVIPLIRENKSGLIINISSIAGRVGLPFQSIYSSTKFALEGLTEALSIELKPFGINVCIIEPGDYKTNVNMNRRSFVPAYGSVYSQRLKNFYRLLDEKIEKGSDPDEIARLVLKIIEKKSPDLRYTAGRIFERITPFSKNRIPDRIFEKILQRFYRL